jgi:uncharacterized repeat protein (TIGR03803 family)
MGAGKIRRITALEREWILAHRAAFAVITLCSLILPASLEAVSYSVLASFPALASPVSPYSSLIQGSDGALYGTTANGGAVGYGTVFRTDTSGTVTTLYSFSGSDGANPKAALVQATDGNFYGTTSGGGTSGQGTVFRIDSTGNLTTLHSFVGSDGSSPLAGLVQGTDGYFYGTTQVGGPYNGGTVFKIDSSGNLTVLHQFGSYLDGNMSWAGLVQATDGSFYGTTSEGGLAGWGTVFKIDTTGSLTILHSLNFYTDGAAPYAGLIEGSDGLLYGTTWFGGAGGQGTVFKIDTSGNLTTLHAFGFGEGSASYAGLFQGTDGEFYGTTLAGGANGLGTVYKVDAAGNFSMLYSFGGSDGSEPQAAVVEATDGYFYGTTLQGGTAGNGTIFRISARGILTTLHSFANPVGVQPRAALVQGTDGFFYGTTVNGGMGGLGTVFKIDGSGNLTTLHSFEPAEGANPYGGLVQGSDGNFYGTTYGITYGPGCSPCLGSVFRIDSSGSFSKLHSFTGGDGAGPEAGVIEGSDGFFYGTTSSQGASVFGTVFKIDVLGNLTTLHSFGGADGGNSTARLTQGSDGYLYGTTSYGGANQAGTVFKIDSSGNLTTLHSFMWSEGDQPHAGLIEGTDGNFYGTTSQGSTSGHGTIFGIDTSGNLTVLHTFGGADGSDSEADLIESSDGAFYGTTVAGGQNDFGSVFRFDVSGSETVVHSFAVIDGSSPYGGVIEGSDGNFYGTTYAGGAGAEGVVFELVRCSSHPSPVIDVPSCLPAHASSVVASVPSVTGDTYTWTLTGGTINSGQGTDAITFACGGFGTLMTLQVDEADSNGCSGTALRTIAVDFEDVPSLDPFYFFVCAVARAGITGGCGGGNFCPLDPVLRSQMAVFLLRAEHGPAYYPPACTVPTFADVPCSDPFSSWIYQLVAEGITGGCTATTFCPSDPVQRGSMAVFLLVTEHGTGYSPPACTGIFTDVPCPGPFTDWIEELYNEGITGGCSNSPLQFCPSNPVTRGQMAVFLSATFHVF